MLNKYLCSIALMLVLFACSGCRKKKVCRECVKEEHTIVEEKRVSGPYADPRTKENVY